MPLLAEWKLERCALKLLWCFALKFFVINFRVEDSLIFMCAAHGKKYGSFPLAKLHLPVSKSLLTQEIWLRLRFIQCAITLDTGGVACGEKLNRSLCSLKIKLFLYAGSGDWGLFNAFSGERKVGRGKSFCHS